MSESQKLNWKAQLKAACSAILERRINTAQQAVAHAQDSANTDDKSSAGDKYEPARAMSQLDRDMNVKQVEEGKKELDIINTLSISPLQIKAGFGAVVVCKEYTFFIALGLGTTVIDGHKVTLLSFKAPIATLLHHKMTGDSFLFNGKAVLILDVF